MEITVVDRNGAEVNLIEHVQPLTLHIERRMVLTEEAERDLEALRCNPRAQEHMRAVMKLVSLRMQAQIFNCSEAWAEAQLTDADRAALATPAELVKRQLLLAAEESQ